MTARTARRNARADNHRPGQHQHRGGADQHQKHAEREADRIGPRLDDAVGAVECGAKCLDGAGREEEREKSAEGQKVDAALAHDGLDLRHQRFSDSGR